MANLTSKELTAIEDQLKAEQLLITKYRHTAQAVSDSKLKTVCTKLASKHQMHFDKLFGLLG